jgi:hypothetical protein
MDKPRHRSCAYRSDAVRSLPHDPASRLALRSPNFPLCQPELPFSRGGVPELALAGVARDLGSSHGSNSFVNFTEFLLKCKCALMQSFYDVHGSPSNSIKNYHIRLR